MNLHFLRGGCCQREEWREKGGTTSAQPIVDSATMVVVVVVMAQRRIAWVRTHHESNKNVARTYIKLYQKFKSPGSLGAGAKS